MIDWINQNHGIVAILLAIISGTGGLVFGF